MRFNFKRAGAVVMALVFLWSGFAFGSPRMTASEKSAYASERASRLLAEIQGEAAGLAKQAGILESLARQPQYNWRSHAFYLEKVKAHINEVGIRTAELQRISSDALPWQQQAIAQVTDHAAQTAASAQAAMLYLNDNPGRLFVPEYRDNIATISASSQNMKQTVDNFLEYEKAQQKFQQLQNTLELAPI